MQTSSFMVWYVLMHSPIPLQIPPWWTTEDPGIPGMHTFPESVNTNLREDRWTACYRDVRLVVRWTSGLRYLCWVEEKGVAGKVTSFDYPHLVTEWLGRRFQEYPSEAQPPPLS